MKSKQHIEIEKAHELFSKYCFICDKKFGDEEIILIPLQTPKNQDDFINAMAICIHKKCYYKEK